MEKLMRDQLTLMMLAADRTLPADERWRGGLWLSIHRENGNHLTLVTMEQIGRLPAGNELCRDAVESVSLRLHGYPQHSTSRQTHDDGKERYCSAVRVQAGGGTFIYACAGYPELWDEAFMIFLALDQDRITIDEMLEIAHEQGTELHRNLWLLRAALWPTPGF